MDSCKTKTARAAVWAFAMLQVVHADGQDLNIAQDTQAVPTHLNEAIIEQEQAIVKEEANAFNEHLKQAFEKEHRELSDSGEGSGEGSGEDSGNAEQTWWQEELDNNYEGDGYFNLENEEINFEVFNENEGEGSGSGSGEDSGSDSGNDNGNSQGWEGDGQQENEGEGSGSGEDSGEDQVYEYEETKEDYYLYDLDAFQEGGGYLPEGDNGENGGLSPEEDGGFTPEEDGGFTPEEDGGFTPEEDGGFTPEEDGGFTPEEDDGPIVVNCDGMIQAYTDILMEGNKQLQQGRLQAMSLCRSYARVFNGQDEAPQFKITAEELFEVMIEEKDYDESFVQTVEIEKPSVENVPVGCEALEEEYLEQVDECVLDLQDYSDLGSYLLNPQYAPAQNKWTYFSCYNEDEVFIDWCN